MEPSRQNPQPPYTVVPMEEPHAREYLAWEYPDPYGFYTIPPPHRAAELANILDCTQGDYFAVMDPAGEIVGMFAYMFPGDMMEIGLGLRPDHCGRGLGYRFVKQCIAYGLARYDHQGPVVLLVSDQNRRAIHLYEKVGFRTATTVTREAYGEPVTFVFMVLDRQVFDALDP